jgi:type VI secretion system protein ImpF
VAELTSSEKLQPCLLDRLTDDEPQTQVESRTQRVISHQRYRAGVLRDLHWLFNASAHLPIEGSRPFRIQDYPEAERSVINFGTRQLCGLTAPSMTELEQQLANAIQFFEPRIVSRTLSVHADQERNLITFELNGELWANPLPEQLYVKTQVDLETGQCLLGDASNG